FFFQAEDGIRDFHVTGVQTCALPISHIALISGVAWDHVNAFPTFENYVNQFRLFIKSIEPKGTLVYNKEDKILQELVLEDRSKRSEERRVGKECRYMRGPYQKKENTR